MKQDGVRQYKKGEQSSAWKADQRTKQSFVPKIIGLDYGEGSASGE